MTPKFIYSAAPQKDQILELKKFCSSDFFDLPLLPFFSREAINFLNELSSKILKRPDIRSFPELLALAFWLRKGNLVPIFQNWQNKVSKEEKVFARGVAFHIAPSNVDSIFLYSWALSLLSGNSNLVRVSRTRSNQLEILFEIINKLYKTLSIRLIRLIAYRSRMNAVNIQIKLKIRSRKVYRSSEIKESNL